MVSYWLLVTILAYSFFALASLCDKLVLAGKPNPKSYTFFVGLFGLAALFLIPFINLGWPSPQAFIWIILYAFVHIIGLYAMYSALERFDVSRVIATIGATQPIFIFILTRVFWGPQAMEPLDILAFVFLLAGSIIISLEKNHKATSGYLRTTILSSAMFSFEYIFAKLIFTSQGFLPGAFWMGIFIFLAVLPLLFKKSARKEIFAKRMVLDKKTQKVFLLAQGFGGVAAFLQSFAISLAPIAFLATINALRGVQYIILFLITLFITFFFPRILRENLSRRVVIQKALSIALIAIGFAVLVIY